MSAENEEIKGYDTQTKDTVMRPFRLFTVVFKNGEKREISAHYHVASEVALVFLDEVPGPNGQPVGYQRYAIAAGEWREVIETLLPQPAKQHTH